MPPAPHLGGFTMLWGSPSWELPPPQPAYGALGGHVQRIIFIKNGQIEVAERAGARQGPQPCPGRILKRQLPVDLSPAGSGKDKVVEICAWFAPGKHPCRHWQGWHNKSPAPQLGLPWPGSS